MNRILLNSPDNDIVARNNRLSGKHEDFKILGFLVATVLFFASTLLASFFGVIALINRMNIPSDTGPYLLMLALLPPSISTFFLFTRVLGRMI